MPNVVGFNPVADPIGYFVVSFLLGIGIDAFITVIKLGLLSSLIVFPFIFLGKWLLPKMREAYETKPIINLFLTCFVITIIFWMLLRVWYVAFGGSFFTTDLIALLIGFIVMAVVLFIFAFIGNYLLLKIQEHWDVPDKLALYLVDIVLCLVFWIVLAILFTIITYI